MINFMTIIADKALDYILPLGGGSIASVIGFITADNIAKVFVCAAIGATVGWFIKLGLDYLRKIIIKKQKK